MAEGNDGLRAVGSWNGRMGLRKEPPFWHQYNTNVKMRWVDRGLLEVFVTEFRDRTSEYYQWAIHQGLCRVNGRKSDPEHRLKMSDQVQNRVHRHEPPVTAEPIRILDRNDEEGRLVVVKPGSIPVHPTGRYYKLTLLEILKDQLGMQTIYTSNRLDRLTSGIMVCSTRKDTAHRLSEQFAMGKVRKAYVCRVRGRFPAGETVVDEPMLNCDRQSGISIIHPLGKHSETIFNLISYDPQSDSSVVYCRPITGRTHQIRVHVQYLGHPILNDPIYAHAIWDRYPPRMFKGLALKTDRWKVEPGSSLNVWGSQELDDVVAGLKMEKDDKEDWARWRDEILFGELLREDGVELKTLPGPNAESPADQRQRAQLANDISTGIDKTSYCDECRIPLLPDPKPEELFIYLHAIKYETDDWSYEDQMPWWALPDWLTSAHGREGAEEDTPIQYGRSSSAAMPPAFGLVGRGEPPRRDAVTLKEVQPLVNRCEEVRPVKMSADDEHPSVVMEVFGGMEDFAMADIARQLRDATDPALLCDVPFQRNTGHIIMPQGHLSDLALRLYLDGQIFCVRSAYLQIAAPEMPADTLFALAKEKRMLLEGKNMANHLRKKGLEGDPSHADLPGMDGQPTELELALISAMRQAWASTEQNRNHAFVEWKRICNLPTEPKPRFRATVDRRGYSLPTLTTSQLAKELGELVWEWLNGKTDLPLGDWEVDLQQPGLDVTLKLLAGTGGSEAVDPHWATKEFNVPGRFAYLIPIPQRTPPSNRPPVPNHLIHGGTALARYRAYTLATALPLPNHDDQGYLRVWEPCVGSGSVAVELAAACARKRISCEVFASDLLTTEVTKAKEMVALCKTEDNVRVGTVDATVLEQAVAFLGQESSLDGIVTDLPWGRRVSSHLSISKLYPAMLRVFVRMLKPGGTALVMTAEQNNLLRAVKTHEAEARKRGWPWLFSVEPISTDGLRCERVDQDQQAALLQSAPTDEQRALHVRSVHCGYNVSIVLLRKRPLLI